MEKTNIDKYLNNTTKTMNGEVYKDANAFRNKVGICYISEGALNDLECWDKDLTDEELIKEGFAETYDTIVKQVTDRWNEFDNEVRNECTIEEIAENVFNSADWCYIATEIDQMTYCCHIATEVDRMINKLIN